MFTVYLASRTLGTLTVDVDAESPEAAAKAAVATVKADHGKRAFPLAVEPHTARGLLLPSGVTPKPLETR